MELTSIYVDVVQVSRRQRSGAMSDMSEQKILRETEDQSTWGPEVKRIRELRKQRIENRQCVFCGKPLGFFDKLAKRTEHGGCTDFKE
jgi:hypothetical protein